MLLKTILRTFIFENAFDAFFNGMQRNLMPMPGGLVNPRSLRIGDHLDYVRVDLSVPGDPFVITYFGVTIVDVHAIWIEIRYEREDSPHGLHEVRGWEDGTESFNLSDKDVTYHR